VKIPKNETLRVTYKAHGLPVFLLTEDRAKNTFVLYEPTEDGVKKLGKAASPIELEEKFGVLERIAEEAKH